MENPTPMINTRRLKPFSQRTSRTVMSILENGDVSMEILAKPQAGTQDGTVKVQETFYINGDGTKVQVYQNNQGDVNKGVPAWSCQEFVFQELPPKQLKKYMHAYRFVELIKSKTPKIVLIADRAKCKMMENSPTPDFQVDFQNGMSILVNKKKVHITDSDGNSMTSDVDCVSHTFPANIQDKIHYMKQCKSECVRLQDSFDGMTANGGPHELFPITVGTSTSPVFIPLPQAAPSICESPLGVFQGQIKKETSIHSEASRALSDSSFSSFSSQTPLSIPMQLADSSENLQRYESPVTVEYGQFNYYSSPLTSSCAAAVNGNLHFSPQAQNILSHSHVQPCTSIPNLEDGAIFSNTSIPPTACDHYGEDNKASVPSSSYSVDSFSNLCLPHLRSPEKTRNLDVDFENQNMFESYNKLKYSSPTDRGDYHNLQLQHESMDKQMFLDQQESLEGNERVPSQINCFNPLSSFPNLVTQQQNFLKTDNPSISIHSVPASSDNSFQIQLGTASASSSLFSGEDISSQHITKEILDASTVSCFSPVQSSSIITTSSSYDYPVSPKKIQRKVASSGAFSIQKQIESLDLSSTKCDSELLNDTTQSSGTEACDAICSLPEFHRSSMKSTRNLSFSNLSTCKTNYGARSKPDLFNTSLPLALESKQHGLSNNFVSPKKLFLQTSDSGSDRGNFDYSLPHQVRNSLDLSTSSNYSDSPSSSQSSSCEPLYQIFIPYTGWASYYASGAIWVLYNDGTQLGVKASEKTMTFIDQDGSHKKYNNKDIVPDIVKMKLEKFPSILNAVLNCKK